MARRAAATSALAIDAARRDLRAAGQADDWESIAWLVAARLGAAMAQVSAGHVRASPMREVAEPRERPAPLGVEVDTAR